MSRFLTAIVALMACLGVSAWENVPFERGTMLVDSLPAGVRTMTFHVRVKTETRGAAEWGIVWNYVSDGDCHGVSVRFCGRGQGDDVFADEVTVVEYDVSGGVRSEISRKEYRGDVDPRGDGFSLRLKVTPSGSVVSGGTASQLFEFPVAFDSRSAGGVGVVTKSPLTVMRRTLDYVPVARPQFTAVEDIEAYLSASDDPCECYWTYFDRNTDPLRANPGGLYTLATVSDGAGGYYILYIDGATVNNDFWRPLQVKGRLTPTVFQGHYNLLWFDSYGEAMTQEQSAAIENASLLTLNFPLYGAVIRFSRAVRTK